MARKRMLSPSWAKHADLYDAEVDSGLPLRVAFAALWTVTDRRGVFAWSRNLKPDVLPYDPCDMLAVLDALAAAGFVEKYQVDGKLCGYIPSFADHQHFHRDEKPSTLPDYPAGAPKPGAVAVAAPVQRVGSTASNGRLATSDIRLADTASTPTPTVPPKAADGGFDEMWPTYPKRTGGNNRAKALKAWKARRSAGVLSHVLREGLSRYAAFVKATGKEGTEFVMMASTFFGPDEHYAEPWTIPAIVVVPPRGRPGPTVTEVADREHNARVQLEERYAAASRRAGLAWATAHPDEFATIKDQVERSYRGLSGGFADLAVKSELAIRCAKEAHFQTYDEWAATAHKASA